MDRATYREFLRAKLERHFDFLPAASFTAFPIELFAAHRRRSEKFFFTKKVNLYSVENDEYILLKEVRGDCAPAMLQQWLNALLPEIPDMLQIGSDHMSSVVSFVLLTEHSFSAETLDLLQKVRYHKDFMFTLRGWVDLAVIGVALEEKTVYSNKFGKKIAANYQWEEHNL